MEITESALMDDAHSATEQLDELLFDLRKEMFGLRMQRGTGQLSRPSRMREVRRDIARIKTLLRERRQGVEQ